VYITSNFSIVLAHDKQSFDFNIIPWYDRASSSWSKFYSWATNLEETLLFVTYGGLFVSFNLKSDCKGEEFDVSLLKTNKKQTKWNSI
jgi:hypothetical protein